MLYEQPIMQRINGTYPYTLDMLRLDLLDPEISGNKWFKLKYNLQTARELGFDTILTFGGAHSNHIAATATAGKRFGFQTIGVIRGERNEASNPTLVKASEQGMILHFVSRAEYRLRETDAFQNELQARFGSFYLVPEGGNNLEGFLGCREILPATSDHDYVLCACGTGTTFAGVVASAKKEQVVIGLSVLKGENVLVNQVNAVLQHHQKPGVYGNEALNEPVVSQHCLSNNYCFNGYASCDEEWLSFKEQFEREHQIPLDYVYTSKLLYAVFDLMKTKKFKPAAKILVLHTGGLQGNLSFERRYHLSPSL